MAIAGDIASCLERIAVASHTGRKSQMADSVIQQLERIDRRPYRERVSYLVDSWDDHVDPDVIGEVAAREVTGAMLDEIHLMLRLLLNQKSSG